MRVLDLFSGIGGFSLGLERAGMETVAFCEFDKKAQLVLKKHWPEIPIYDDIRQLTGKQIAEEIGAIELICGGFPCQPFSQAGKRRGDQDDRHLWPEMFRLIQEIRPNWVIGENVAGLINMGLDQVLSDLEGEGYTCQTFIVPACAVNAPHRRDRVWIVAHSDGDGRGGVLRKTRQGKNGAQQWENSNGQSLGDGRNGPTCQALPDVSNPQSQQDRRLFKPRIQPDIGTDCENVPDSGHTGILQSGINGEIKKNYSGSRRICRNDIQGRAEEAGKVVANPDTEREPQPQGGIEEKRGRVINGGENVPDSEIIGVERRGAVRVEVSQAHVEKEIPRGDCSGRTGGNWSVEPQLGRVAHGVPNRVDRLKQLGNAVVPQVVEMIGTAIMEIVEYDI